MSWFWILGILNILLSAAFSVSFLRLLASWYTPKVSLKQCSILGTIVGLITGVIFVWTGMFQYAILATFILWILFLDTLFVFEENRVLTIIMWACIYSFTEIVGIGILEALSAITLNGNITNYAQYKTLWMLIGMVSFSMGLGVSLVLHAKEETMEKLRTLLHYEKLFENCSVATLMLFSGVVISTLIYQYTEYNFYGNVLYIVFEVSSLVVSIFIVNFGVKVSTTIAQEYRQVHMQEQLNLEMLHYRSYADFTRGLRRFQDTYKQMMGTIYEMLLKEDYEHVKAQIDEINEVMYHDIAIRKECSNHPLVDAIMQAVANQCDDQSIDFKCKIYAPQGITLSDQDLCHLFQNVSLYLLAILSENDEMDSRYLSITSGMKDKWILVTCTISCEKKPVESDEMNIVKKILEDSHNLCQEKWDKDKQEYSVVIGLKKG